MASFFHLTLVIAINRNGDEAPPSKLQEFEALRDDPMAAAAPSPFSRFVIEFATKCPSKGPGISRDIPDWGAMMNRHIVKTTVKKAAKMVRCWEDQWKTHATTVLSYPMWYACTLWKYHYERATKDEITFDGPPLGPNGSRMPRIDMPYEDFTEAGNEVGQEKALEMRSKARRMDEASVATLTDSLGKGHVSFSNSIFDSVGGDSLSRLAREGGSAVVGALGQGVLGSAAEVAIAASSPQLHEKSSKKSFEVGQERINLDRGLADKINDVEAKAKEAIIEADSVVTEFKEKQDSEGVLVPFTPKFRYCGNSWESKGVLNLNI